VIYYPVNTIEGNFAKQKYFSAYGKSKWDIGSIEITIKLTNEKDYL